MSGELTAIPQERHLSHRPDKRALGLKPVPRLDSWRGMIFGSFDPEIEPLDGYLGDMKWYLDAFFERFVITSYSIHYTKLYDANPRPAR